MMNFKSDSVDRLFHAIMLLENDEECAAFFEDICTITEIKNMAERLDAALMLENGENYQKIAKDIGISTATISRVSKCINYGAGGYKTVIERLKGEEK